MIVQSEVKISGGMELIIPRRQDSVPGWISGRSQSGRLVCVRQACLFIHATKKAPGHLGTEVERRLPKNRLVLFILPTHQAIFAGRFNIRGTTVLTLIEIRGYFWNLSFQKKNILQ